MLQKIIKDSASFKHLIAEKNSQKLSHAIMLIGTDKVYQDQYARLFAQELFCEDCIEGKACNECINCKNAYNLTTADIIVYGKESAITTKEAEEIISNSLLRPYSANKKLYVLYNYDLVNDTVENKLLKTIEEPPKDVVFLILVSNINKLLQTTLSRTQKIFLEGLTISQLTDILKEQGTQDAEIVAIQANGSLEKAQGYTKGNVAKEITELVINCLLNMNNTQSILMYVSKFQTYDSDLQDVINCFASITLDVIRAKARATKIITNKMYATYIKQMSENLSYTALTKIVEATYTAKQMQEANVMSTNIIDQLLLKIVEVKLKCKR